MKRQSMPKEFSGFFWALMGFCLPVFLWPLALLISPNLLKNTNLTDFQVTAMSIFLWVYPFVLGIMARVIYKVHQTAPQSGKRLLGISAVIFYAVLCYVAVVGFN
ncbi:DUF5389 domain-containing protein [Caviibacterium pharyngocola]|uniref:Uncharacterized protein n=1 Tax=Caviibacterium pharyngocola TaxID=28159 RepID=A0A2M8RXS5_9PAST|nr:DUF5389 domain-containing protein [Caviibacterium pharyngocola]PJG83693.1 hypothetical protein CVP04_03435 [Caviibacterium pharyngocola]